MSCWGLCKPYRFDTNFGSRKFFPSPILILRLHNKHKTQNNKTSLTHTYTNILSTMISTLQSEENRKRFLQSISVLSNCLSERQGAEHAFNSETSSLHNLFSLGVEVISKLPAPEIARDHLPRITNSETDYTKPNAGKQSLM